MQDVTPYFKVKDDEIDDNQYIFYESYTPSLL